MTSGNESNHTIDGLTVRGGLRLEQGPGVLIDVGASMLAPRVYAQPKTSSVIVTTFQTGHGWTQSGANGTVNLNDTTDYVLGSQSAWLLTDGSGVNSNQIRITGAPAVDLSAKGIRVWLKCDDWTKISQIQLYVGDTAFTNFMIARIGDDLGSIPADQYLKSGEWGVVDVPWASVVAGTGSLTRSAVTAWQFRVVDNGTPVKLHVNGVASIPDMSAVYPNGVVSFAFDDGWVSQYTEARKKLDQYGWGATAHTIVDKIDSGGGWLTMDQLHKLEQLSGWEVAGHASTTTNHNAGFDSLTPAVLNQEFRNQKQWLVDNGFRGVDLFAWPLGQFTIGAALVAGQYWSFARTVNGTRHEVVPPRNPLRAMPRIGLGPSTAVATVTGHIDDAYAGQGWLIIYAHEIVTSAVTSTQFSIANFGLVVDYCNTKGIPVVTIGRVLESAGKL